MPCAYSLQHRAKMSSGKYVVEHADSRATIDRTSHPFVQVLPCRKRVDAGEKDVYYSRCVGACASVIPCQRPSRNAGRCGGGMRQLDQACQVKKYARCRHAIQSDPALPISSGFIVPVSTRACERCSAPSHSPPASAGRLRMSAPQRGTRPRSCGGADGARGQPRTARCQRPLVTLRQHLRARGGIAVGGRTQRELTGTRPRR